MATLPGMPKDDEEPEPDALPVEPDDGAKHPVPNPEPHHEPVEIPQV